VHSWQGRLHPKVVGRLAPLRRVPSRVDREPSIRTRHQEAEMSSRSVDFLRLAGRATAISAQLLYK